MGKLAPLCPVSVCEGHAEMHLLGGVEQAASCLGVPCSAPSQHSLVLTTLGWGGALLACGLGIAVALLPVLAASPHRITGSWPREAWSVMRRVYLAVQKCQVLIF